MAKTTDIKQMALVYAVLDRQQKLIDLQDKQNEELAKLLDSMNAYLEWSNETITRLEAASENS